MYYLEAYSMEENMQRVCLLSPPFDPDTTVDWDITHPIEDTCRYISFECPECKTEIWKNRGDSQDARIKAFLMGDPKWRNANRRRK